jgi:hypothetical protein
MFQMSWCVIHRDVDDVIAETCRRDGNCTVMCMVCTYFGSVNKTHCIEVLAGDLHIVE